MVLSDIDIAERCSGETPMISPFCGAQVRAHNGHRCISYGLSSYGYDIRLGRRLRIARDPSRMVGGDLLDRWVIDPKDETDRNFCDATVHKSERGEYVELPAHGFALAHSVERFVVPRDLMVLCFGKSTYARCGLIVNVTPLEPEWEGYLTLEISNTTPQPARVYLEEGISQLVFHTARRTCSVSYGDRRGKYNNQPAEPVSPRV